MSQTSALTPEELQAHLDLDQVRQLVCLVEYDQSKDRFPVRHARRGRGVPGDPRLVLRGPGAAPGRVKALFEAIEREQDRRGNLW